MNKADKKVLLPLKVTGDFPFNDVIAEAGIHEAYVNPHGAVSVKATNGEMLGVKPNEFVWID